jgi:hypothetical protein
MHYYTQLIKTDYICPVNSKNKKDYEEIIVYGSSSAYSRICQCTDHLLNWLFELNPGF